MTASKEKVGEYMRRVVAGVRHDEGRGKLSADTDRGCEGSESDPALGPRERFLRSRRAYEQSESRTNAWAVIDLDAADRRSSRLEEAVRTGDVSGKLWGWTVGVKDLIDVVGFPTANGSAVPGEYPTKDASVVEKLRFQGANILGKTETHEFAYGLITPQTANAHRSDRIAGGSSGGSAVTVANGSADVALGTDTGGSVRVPAALNGVFGFKPTRGRLPLDGVTPLSNTLDHLGIIAATGEGLERVFAALDPLAESPAALPRSMRIGALRIDRIDHIQPAIVAAYGKFLRAWESEGATVSKIDLPLWDKVAAVHYGIMGPEASAQYAFLSKTDRELLRDETRDLLDGGHGIPATDYLHAQRWREELKRQWFRLFEDLDVVVLPTTPIVAPHRGDEVVRWSDGRVESVTDALVRWCVPANIVGLPALTVPFGCDPDGLPIGLQVLGPPDSDRLVLGATRRLVEGLYSSDTTTEEARCPRQTDPAPVDVAPESR